MLQTFNDTEKRFEAIRFEIMSKNVQGFFMVGFWICDEILTPPLKSL
jgi:hypothetical protein